MSPACRCHWIADWKTAMTTQRTESEQQDHWGYATGIHPFLSSSLMTCHHLSWYGILPLNWRGCPAADVMWLISLNPSTRNCDWTKLIRGRHEGMPGKHGEVASRVYPLPIHQTVIDSCWVLRLPIFNFHTTLFIMVFLYKYHDYIVCDTWKWTQLAI